MKKMAWAWLCALGLAACGGGGHDAPAPASVLARSAAALRPSAAPASGAPATVVQLWLALYGQVPGIAEYQSATAALMGNGAASYAGALAANFATVSDADLATQVLANLGISEQSLPNRAPAGQPSTYVALRDTVVALFKAYGLPARGVIVLNLVNLLAGLAQDATYGPASVAFTQKVLTQVAALGDYAVDLPDRHTLLPLTAANASDAAAASMVYGAIALTLGQRAVEWLAMSDAANGQPASTPCMGGTGSQTVSLTDRNGDGKPSAGDLLAVRLSGCYLIPGEEKWDGSIVISIASAGGAAKWAGSMRFGPDFSLPLPNTAKLQVTGGLRFEYSIDRLSSTVHVTSDAQPLGFVASGPGGSGADYLTRLDAMREAHRATARATTTLRYHFDGDSLGGSLEVATPTPWASWPGTFPDAGVLAATGAAGASVQLRAQAPGAPQFAVYLGGTAAGLLLAAGLDANYLWSMVGWKAPDNRLLDYGITVGGSSEAFQLLAAPSEKTVSPNPAPLVWVFSRPLAANAIGDGRFQPNNGLCSLVSVPAKVLVEGAMVSYTATSQLVPGCEYTLYPSGFSIIQVKDTAGHLARMELLVLTALKSVTASATVGAPGMLVGPGASLVLDGSASTAAGQPVASIRWRQVSGPALSLAGVDQPRLTVTPAAAANGQAVVELEVRNAAGDVDRQQLKFIVLADMPKALLVAFRQDNRPPIVVTSGDPGVYSPSATYFTNALNGSGFRVLITVPGTLIVSMFYTEPSYALLTPGQEIFNPQIVWSPQYYGSCSPQGSSGHMKVLDFAKDSAGTLQRLAVDFELSCTTPSPGTTMYGSVRYNSTLPLRL